MYKVEQFSGPESLIDSSVLGLVKTWCCKSVNGSSPATYFMGRCMCNVEDSFGQSIVIVNVQ